MYGADPFRQALMRALHDYAPALLVAKDLQGVYRMVSPTAAILVGMQVEDIVGRTDHEVFPEELADVYRSHDLQVAEEGEPLEFEEDLEIDGERRCWRFAKFPLFDAAGTMIGVGSLGTDLTERRAVEDELKRARNAAELAARELRKALADMERLAVTDRLTGVWNRRRLEEAAAIEIARADRYHTRASLLMIDLDHFKRINDRLGHAAGDAALVEFCSRIRRNIRESDSLARWGGEEFIVLAPSSRLSEAVEVAEKLREAVSGAPFAGGETITASIGVAEHLPGERFDTWVRRADAALYQAKHNGRNRVEHDTATGLIGERRGTRPDGGFVNLVWRTHYESGHGQIDAQHRDLFALANALLDASLVGKPGEQILKLAMQLKCATTHHFSYEEALLTRIGYPDIEHHRREHQELLDRAASLFDEAREDRATVPELFQFLAYDVIAHHLLGADRLYFPALRASQSAQDDAAASA